MSARPMTQTDSQAGFSLLETLFALAIMSLASVALFQSTSSMLALSDRAVAAGERAVNSGLDRLAVNGVIDGLLPHWPHESESTFTGTARQLKGLTTGTLNTDISRPETVTLSFASGESGDDILFYRSAAAPQGWALMSGLPQGARFEYMGIDHNWYAAWPPEVTPSRGYFNEEALQSTPALPAAIRARSGDFILWTSRVSKAVILPDTLDLEAGL